MKIDFDNPRHETLVNDIDALLRKFDRRRKVSEDIIAAIEVLRAANSLFDVPRAYRPHPLQHEYKGCFAVDVTKTHRVIFKPNHDGDPDFRIDNYKTITSVIILEIFKDYH